MQMILVQGILHYWNNNASKVDMPNIQALASKSTILMYCFHSKKSKKCIKIAFVFVEAKFKMFQTVT